MTSYDHSFAGKFLSRLRKIDPEQVESFLAQVLREKAFLEQVFHTLTDGIIVTEGTKKIVFVNGAAKKLLHLTKDSQENAEAADVFEARQLGHLLEEFRESLEPISQREVEIHKPHTRELTVSAVPLENEDGLMTHAVWVFGDRTELRRREEEKRQIDNLESLAALTAGVAHEVKNPLNSLNIHAQLIGRAADAVRNKVGDDPALERLEKSTNVILEEISRLARVVDDFTHAVRPVRPNKQRRIINDVCISVAELLGPACSEQGIELTVDLDPEVPPIAIDSQQLEQAILNILKNGLEAVEPNQGKLTIRTRLKSDHVAIEVADNGCGISEEDKLRIFEPYHTTKFDGTGLGLMVVYRIIRAHKGAVVLKSEVGVGTVFSLALPLDEKPVKLLEAHVEPELELMESED